MKLSYCLLVDTLRSDVSLEESDRIFRTLEFVLLVVTILLCARDIIAKYNTLYNKFSIFL